MKLHVIIPLVVLLYLSPTALTTTHVTKTIREGAIRGIRKTLFNNKNVDIFLGVPYGKPPVGNLRFKAPEPAASWSGIKDTTNYQKQCQQSDASDFEKNNKAGGIWYSSTPKSEDCLFLNVWAPQNANNVAVMVWIYGGGYFSGTTHLAVYDGDVLAAKENVIVVSMEYRLGAFGFLYLGNNEAPGNQGLLDQELALKWVANNIRVFGGDPGKVTVFGESAGGTSALFQAIKPNAENLFSKLIIQSGSFYSYWSHQSKEFALTNANKLAGLLGCTNGNITCLRQASTKDLNDKYWSVNRNTERQDKIEAMLGPTAAKNAGMYFDVGFQPVADGNFVPIEFGLNPEKYTLQAFADKKDLSIMIGINKNEASYFLLYGIHDPDYAQLAYKSSGQVVLPPIMDRGYKAMDSQSYVIQALLPERLIVNGVSDSVVEKYKVLSKNDSAYSQLETFKMYDNLASDSGFKCPCVDLANYLSAVMPKDRIFFYEFEHRTASLIQSFPEWVGVMHGYEVEYIFGTPFNSRFNAYSHTTEERALSEEMMKMWSNFATTGNPSTTTTPWPAYNSDTKKYMVLNTGAAMATRSDPRKNYCNFWLRMREIADVINSGERMRIFGDKHSSLLWISVTSVWFYIIVSRSN